MTRDAERTPSPQSVELLPCPFCGTTAHVVAFPRQHEGRMAAKIECFTDFCYAVVWAETPSQAITAWNRRAAPAPSSLASGEVREIIETLEDLTKRQVFDAFDRGARAARLDALDMIRPLAALSPEAPARDGVDAIMNQLADIITEASVDYPAGRDAGHSIDYDEDAIRAVIEAALTPKEAPAATITSAELIANTDYARGAVRVPGETADRRIYGQPEAPAATGDDATLVELRSAGLRSAGWSVAVHNDYRLNGEPNTFWLWTHPSGRWIKGEGKTDADALQQCIDALTPRHEAPAPRPELAPYTEDLKGIKAAMLADEAPAEGAGEIASAARALLDACYKADENSDLSDFVDGMLLTRLDKALRARSSAPEAREEALGNLLAVIHGDGGHRALEVGVEQAAAEAEKIVAGLFAAPSADKLREAMPDLSSVIAWLANGCDPQHAVTELGIYKARIDQALANQGADQ